MKRYFANIVVLMLATIALLGQSMAYATMPCSAIAHANNVVEQGVVNSLQMNQEMNHLGMDHSMMDHSMMGHETSTDSDETNHCGSDCQCPKGSCASAPCIVSLLISYSDTFPESKIVAHTTIDVFNLTSPLFRPPILA